MNVLIDVRLLSPGHHSGIEEYTRHLVSGLLEQGTSHHFKLFYNGRRKVLLPSAWLVHPRAETIDWRLPNKFLDASFRFFDRPRLASKFNSDLVFSPHFNYLSPGSSPLLLTIHDLSFLHYPEFFSRRQRLWHFRSARHQIRRAAHIIADSLFTKSDLLEFFNLDDSQVSVIYPGLSSEFKVLEFPGSESRLSALSRKYNLFRPFLLYLGALEPRKNVDALVRAFNLLSSKLEFKNFDLVLAGGKGWLHQDIMREINLSPVRERIKVIRSVLPEERVLLYNKAKAFVYPSFFEGFGFPPLEAQACGLPVVAADRTSLPEILGSSALLVDPWDVSKLAEAISEAVFNEASRQRLISAGRENCQRFSWPNTAKQVLKLIESFS